MKLYKPDYCEGLKSPCSCSQCNDQECVWNTNLWLRWRFWCYEKDIDFGWCNRDE